MKLLLQSPEDETEESRYRSYREDAKKNAKVGLFLVINQEVNTRQLKQKFKIGRVVWFKTDRDGTYRMAVVEATHNSGSNTWSYKLKDTMGQEHGEWVAETKLTAANPAN